jgi:hypothetical protein
MAVGAVAALQEVPPGVLTEFEHELEEDLASVAVTLTAVTGVIIFWRGVWSLLDCESALRPALLSHSHSQSTLVTIGAETATNSCQAQLSLSAGCKS